MTVDLHCVVVVGAPDIKIGTTRRPVDVTYRRGPLVDDLAAEHQTGPVRTFDNSFVPRIADNIGALGIPQLVVIFPQRSTVAGNRVESEDEFAFDARQWFEHRSIAYLDLYTDERITNSDFGGGDHLSDAGRSLATEEVIRVLQEMGISTSS